jgi:PTH2 family peptidyl-tRNA hydrolase
VVAGAALGLGYYLGSQMDTQDAAPAAQPIPPSEPKEPLASKAEPEVDSEEEDDALADGDLSAVKAGFVQPCKLVRAGIRCRFHLLTSTPKGLSRANGSQNDHWENSCTVSTTRLSSAHLIMTV